MIDIKGFKKSDVLRALYNAARPLGMGRLQFIPGDMSVQEAEEIINNGNPESTKKHCLSFDYLHGRVMKVDISGLDFEERLYDRDNGEGAAAAVIAELRASYPDPEVAETAEAEKAEEDEEDTEKGEEEQVLTAEQEAVKEYQCCGQVRLCPVTKNM